MFYICVYYVSNGGELQISEILVSLVVEEVVRLHSNGTNSNIKT